MSSVAQAWATDLSANRGLFNTSRTAARSPWVSAFGGAGRGARGRGAGGRRAR